MSDDHDDTRGTTTGRANAGGVNAGRADPDHANLDRANRQDDALPVGPVFEQRGLWFEEFVVGATYRHRPGRTVTEADNVLFSTLTMNGQSLHLDAAWSATQPFGERLVNSMFTLSTVVGLSVAQLTEGTIVANLGFTEVAFPHPLHHGDTLYAETVILDKRPSRSRPGQGIVSLEHLGRNQDAVVVVRAVRSTLVRFEPADGGGR